MHKNFFTLIHFTENHGSHAVTPSFEETKMFMDSVSMLRVKERVERNK